MDIIEFYIEFFFIELTHVLVLFSDGSEAAPDFSSSWTQQGTTR